MASDSSADAYRELKASGLCVRCRKQDAGERRCLCEPCQEYRRNYRRDNAVTKAEADRKAREEKQAAGVCVRCWKDPAAEGISACRPCADAMNAKRRASRIIRGVVVNDNASQVSHAPIANEGPISD